MKFARLCASLTGGRPLVSLELTPLFFLILTLKYCVSFMTNDSVSLSRALFKKETRTKGEFPCEISLLCRRRVISEL